MAAKITRLTHKIAIQLRQVAAIPFAVLAQGGQSGKFWIHPRITKCYKALGVEHILWQ
jgi:hypothetical protein